MKLDRRAFIKLISATSAAMVSGCLGISWLLGQTVRGLERGPQPTDFPVEWSTDKETQIDLQSYKLNVIGDVPKPLHLTIDDLNAMPQVQKTTTMLCGMGHANWSQPVLWEGIPLSYLLSQAGVSSLDNVDRIIFEAVTGYRHALQGQPLANPDNMIALKADGAPLTVPHGYPARLVAPPASAYWKGGYGDASVKYLGKITVKKR
jgi:DMSO/TMAO reductase YedYZ molybdopterin-dependent catalytic subunit